MASRETLAAAMQVQNLRTQTVDRLQKLHASQSRLLRSQYRVFIKRATDPEAIDTVMRLMRYGRVEEVLRQNDTHIIRFSHTLGHVLINAGNHEANHWHSRLKVLNKADNLNLADKKIAVTIAQNQQNFATNLSRQQRDVVRTSLINGLRKGESPDQMARRFKRTIGLSQPQQTAVENYQRALETNSRSALTYTLRNPKFDDKVENAIDENAPLTSNQIEMMVGAYTRNMQQERADTIAITESLKIINQGRDIAVRQAAELAGIRGGTKTWLPTTAAEPRETHLRVAGTTISLDEAFDVGGVDMLYPGDTSLGAGPDNIINCQCGIEYNLEDQGNE